MVQLTFSPKGDHLAAGLEDGRLLVLNSSSGAVEAERVESISPYPVTGLAWLAGNPGLVVASTLDGEVTGWNLSKNNLVWAWGPVRVGGQVRSLTAEGKDQPIIALSSDVGLALLEGQSGKLLHIQNINPEEAGAIAFSTDGRYLAVSASQPGSAGYRVVLWEVENWSRVTWWDIPSESTSLTFRADGMIAASYGQNAELLEWQSGARFVKNYTVRAGSPAVWDEGGKNLFVVLEHGRVGLLDTTNGEVKAEIGLYSGPLNALYWKQNGTLSSVSSQAFLEDWSASSGAMTDLRQVMSLPQDGMWELVAWNRFNLGAIPEHISRQFFYSAGR